VDLAAVSIGIGVAASVESDVSPYGLVAGTWYGVGLVAAPAVHYAGQQWPLGLGDFALRTLFPPLIGLTGILAACVAHDEFDSGCARAGVTGGLLFGLAGAAAFDALVLSSAPIKQAPGPTGSWYGVQILVIDAIAYGLGAIFAAKKPREGHDRPHPGLALWVADYAIGVIGAPIVHFAHGNIGFGFASLGMRLLLSPIGAVIGLIGACSAAAGSKDCPAEGAQWGLLGGSLTIALFDALVFAREKSDKPATASNFGVSLGAGSIGVRSSW
jgi:hypothetical protein